jgi:TetR/AcrR family transcriptional repressor of mexJK operon
MLDDLARRMARAIMRPEVIVLRRLLVGEARAFPALGAEYFERAPAQVLAALAAGFERLTRDGLLRCPDPRIAAAQFAYLIVGEPLDRAMLVGTVASEEQVLTAAREGVQTFLARYAGKRVVR